MAQMSTSRVVALEAHPSSGMISTMSFRFRL